MVENGEVIALLDIAKCLYDAIARMERAAEKGKAIAAAVEGVEKHWGAFASGLLEINSFRMPASLKSNLVPWHMFVFGFIVAIGQAHFMLICLLCRPKFIH